MISFIKPVKRRGKKEQVRDIKFYSSSKSGFFTLGGFQPTTDPLLIFDK